MYRKEIMFKSLTCKAIIVVSYFQLQWSCVHTISEVIQYSISLSTHISQLLYLDILAQHIPVDIECCSIHVTETVWWGKSFLSEHIHSHTQANVTGYHNKSMPDTSNRFNLSFI